MTAAALRLASVPAAFLSQLVAVLAVLLVWHPHDLAAHQTNAAGSAFEGLLEQAQSCLPAARHLLRGETAGDASPDALLPGVARVDDDRRFPDVQFATKTTVATTAPWLLPPLRGPPAA